MSNSRFAFQQFVSHLLNQAVVLAGDAEHLESVLAAQRTWQRDAPAFAMMRRRLRGIARKSKKLELVVAEVRERCTDQNNDHDALGIQHGRMLVKSATELQQMARQLCDCTRVMQQRSYLEDIPNWVTRHQSVDNPKESQAFFRALEGFVVSLFLDIFGRTWVETKERQREPWLPLAIVDEEYSVPTLAHVVNVPRVDLFSSRLWPMLAHEVAHLKVVQLFGDVTGIVYTHPKGEPLTAKVEQQLELLSIRPSDFRDIRGCFEQLANAVDADAMSAILGQQQVRDLWWYSHSIEFLCDAVSAYVMGPATLLSLLTVNQVDPSEISARTREEILETIVGFEHPPTRVRRGGTCPTTCRRGKWSTSRPNNGSRSASLRSSSFHIKGRFSLIAACERRNAQKAGSS